MRRETTARGRAQLTEVGGWIAVGYGVTHVIVVPVRRCDDLARAKRDGWWGVFTLAEPTTLADAERALTLWQTIGSFGVPTVALGSHLVWSAREGRRVPAWLGGIVLTWGVAFVTALPKSPSWALPLIGGLIIAGDTATPQAPGRPTSGWEVAAVLRSPKSVRRNTQGGRRRTACVSGKRTLARWRGRMVGVRSCCSGRCA